MGLDQDQDRPGPDRDQRRATALELHPRHQREGAVQLSIVRQSALLAMPYWTPAQLFPRRPLCLTTAVGDPSPRWNLDITSHSAARGPGGQERLGRRTTETRRLAARSSASSGEGSTSRPCAATSPCGRSTRAVGSQRAGGARAGPFPSRVGRSSKPDPGRPARRARRLRGPARGRRRAPPRRGPHRRRGRGLGTPLA